MLELCFHNKRNFRFFDPNNVDLKSNIFTILVGKNGTGKSRLLSAIIQDFLSKGKTNPSDNETPAKNRVNTLTNYTKKPTKIIAASTSPFDRFPIIRRNTFTPEYSYLGLRDLLSQNFGMAYMSKIISSLLEAINEDSSQMQDIADVLRYLGYNDNIQLKFELRLSSRYVHELIESSNPLITLESIFDTKHRLPSLLNINRTFFYTENDKIDEDKTYRLIALLKSLNLFGARKPILFQLTKSGLISNSLFDVAAKDVIFLMQSGIIRLREVTLEKTNSKSPYLISDASSGEQSVVLGFLGIASQIQNNCLICIDEPEICLHPEWQERYIRLLISTFRRYHDCHFIIATHSPQIISKLESNNCFVLSMDNGEVTNATDYINNSVDFQLANVFKSPGFKNEYLSRMSFSLFAKTSANRKFDESDITSLAFLLEQEKLLETNDPVYLLITTLKEMRKEYARNK